MKYEELLSSLLELDAERLREVRNRCALLLQGGAAPAQTARAAKPGRPPDGDADLILEEISAFLRSEGIEYAGVDRLRGMANYRAFLEKVPASMEYFHRVTTNRTKLRALIKMSVRMLYQDMTRMNISPSVRTIMNHWHRVPAVVNRNFPGYAASGLLSLLVRDGRTSAKYVLNEPAEE